MPTTPRLFELVAPELAGDLANMTYTLVGPTLTVLVGPTAAGISAVAAGYTAAVAFDASWPAHGSIRWYHSAVEVVAEAFDLAAATTLAAVLRSQLAGVVQASSTPTAVIVAGLPLIAAVPLANYAAAQAEADDGTTDGWKGRQAIVSASAGIGTNIVLNFAAPGILGVATNDRIYVS
jgi:hypothetical protein